MRSLRRLQYIIDILKLVYILLSVIEFRHSLTTINFSSRLNELCSKCSVESLFARYHDFVIVLSLVFQCFAIKCLIITYQAEKLKCIIVVPSMTMFRLIRQLIQDEEEKRFYSIHMMIGFTLALLIKWKGRPLPEPVMIASDRGIANRG